MIDYASRVQLDDILAAREVIQGKLHRTPIMRSTYLSERAGVNVALKLELFQKTGAFKARGALNKMAHLTPEEKAKGVLAFSAGNHAQGVAWAASKEGIKSVIVMPVGAVRSKVAATEGYGGEVIFVEGNLREQALRIQQERDLTLVHPFDDPYIIAGQGTVGLEIAEDVPDVSAVISGIGGGGLVCGVSVAIKSQHPDVRLIGVEPQGASAMSQSVKAGEMVWLDKTSTVADGLAAAFVGDYTFPMVQKYVDDLVVVSDEEIIAAMKLVMERCKVVPEPAAASTVAALLSGRANLPKTGTVVCILSGGNIDVDRLKTLL
jgi:threonine dehydratase